MYLVHFKLLEYPFRLNADPKFLYLSESHQKALSYLKYGIEVKDSLVLLSGEIGAGKTTLLNALAGTVNHECVIGKVFQTQLKDIELLQSVMVAFGQEIQDTDKVSLLNQLNQFLTSQYRRGKHSVLIIDEAQHLSLSMFEELRLLSDSELNGESLITIILAGQPELREALDDSALKQLKQRIRLKVHLGRLSLEDTRQYIKHRLNIAGAEGREIFSEESFKPIYYFTGGCLRLVNILCDYALTHCFSEDLQSVSADTIRISTDELGWDAYDYSDSVDDDQTRLLPILNSTPVLKLLINDNGQTNEYTVRRSSRIGRHKDNDLVIDNPRVSRFHAEIVDRNGRWYVRDLESMNGVRVNHKRVEMVPICTGDVITIGGVNIQCNLPFDMDSNGLVRMLPDSTARFKKNNVVEEA
ncbi:MAG: AAA family ATPase [Gammaproteobacteria bacterium]|nr:AAA family ATPase [Gammaproteobacteria bacterium]